MMPRPPARLTASLPWEVSAQERLESLVEAEPMLVRISAAKRLREQAERVARSRGDVEVTLAHVDGVDDFRLAHR